MEGSFLGDPERLRALARTGLMDSAPEEVFDRLTRLAARLLGTPIAVMTLLDDERQFAKSGVGLGEGPLLAADLSFCQYVVRDAAPLTVEDVRLDPRIAPAAAQALAGEDLLTYAGVPLIDSDGHTLGSLCAMDDSPREWDREDVELLRELAVSAMTEIELRRAYAELTAREQETRAIVEGIHEGFIGCELDGTVRQFNAAAEQILGHRAQDVLGTCAVQLLVDGDCRERARQMLAAPEQIDGRQIETHVRHRDGHAVHLELSLSVVELKGARRVNVLARDVGARRARQREQARLAQIVAAAAEAICTVDLEYRVTSWNGGCERLYGYPAAEVLGRPFPPVETGDPDMPSRAELTKRALAGESVFAAAVARRRKDGSLAHVDLTFVAQRDENGEIVGVVSIGRDITDEHRLRHDLRSSERRFRRTFDDAPTGITLVAPDRTVVRANRAFCTMVGYREEDLIGQTLEHITDPADRDNDLEGARTMLDGTSNAYQVEKRYHHRDGHVVRVALTASLVHDAQGAPAYFIAHTQDVTAEREAEAAVAAALGLLDESQASAHVGSWSFDLEAETTSWSREQFRLHGLPPDATPPSVAQLLELVHPDDRGAMQATLASIMRRPRSFEGEYRVVDPDGGVRWLHSSAELLAADPVLRRPRRVSGTTRDVTAERRAQAARRAIEDRLRVTVDHAPIGVALVDLRDGPHGRLVSVNPAFGRLLGDPDPAAGELSLTSIIHPDDVAPLRSDLALLTAGELERLEREVRCLHPDGHLVWLLLTGTAVPPGEDEARLAVVHALDIGERKRFEGQLQHLADHDVLTGLFNRRRLEQELMRTVSLVERYDHPTALLMVDLDGFKHVNDTMGHSFGDEILTRVGSALRTCLRDTDVLGRLGGDEFAIIVNNVEADEAQVVADKVLDAIREHGVVVSDHRHASVTASVGVALIERGRGLDAEGMLARADAAMYAAKQAGKNRIAFAPAAGIGAAELVTQRSWLTRLRAALDQDRFELHAQPIRGICAGDESRFELLLRMRGEDGELISPGTFLYNAERFDLIQEIDRWVLGQALELLTRHDAARSGLALSINMSARTLGDPRLIDDLHEILSGHPSPEGRLVVEVTETAAIVNIDRAREVARSLRALGCRFALDDFGAGFASFYYLKHLDFDYVKIDGEFIKAMTGNATDQLVVRSVVSLAQGLGAQTIAEFVSDDATIRLLRRMGVDYGQGFHLGRPEPVELVLPRSVLRV